MTTQTSSNMQEAVQYTTSPARESLISSPPPRPLSETFPQHLTSYPQQPPQSIQANPQPSFTTVHRNEYYKFPNSIELHPGDTCGLETLYDAYRVRTFRGENQHVMLGDEQHLRNRGGRRPMPGRSRLIDSSVSTASESGSLPNSNVGRSKMALGGRGRKSRMAGKGEKPSGRRYSDIERHDRNESDGRNYQREAGDRNGDEGRHAKRGENSAAVAYHDVLPCQQRRRSICHEIHVHHYHCPEKNHQHHTKTWEDDDDMEDKSSGRRDKLHTETFEEFAECSRRPRGVRAVMSRQNRQKRREDQHLYRGYRKQVPSESSFQGPRRNAENPRS